MWRRLTSLLVPALLLALLVWSPAAQALTVGEVVKDLACPCVCPLVLEDCNMTCGLEWKEEVGKLVAAGKSKQEIMDYFIATYGEGARLTTWQRIEGKTYQYTRSFGTTEWALLWIGAGFWIIVLFGGFYFGVRRLFFPAKSA